MKLTNKQQEIFNKLLDLYGNEPLPSFDLICNDLGFKSKNSVWQYFQKFIEIGLIKEKFNRFFIPSSMSRNDESGSTSLKIPHFIDGVRAGFPTMAEGYTDNNISFDEMLIKKPYSTFCVNVVGDSMIDAGICDGDMVVVEKGESVRDGDIVVANVDGDFTLKYYRIKNGKIWLEPANSNYPNIIPQNELMVVGLVTGLVRKY